MQQEVIGALDTVRKVDIEQMNNWIGLKMDPHLLIGKELALEMVAMSYRLQKEIAIYINRRGMVLTVVMGNKRDAIVPPDLESSAGDLRCIHTHPNASSQLSELDLSVLEKFDLGLISAIGLNDKGEITGISIAYQSEDGLQYKSYQSFESVSDEDVLPMLEANHRLQRMQNGVSKEIVVKERALLIGVMTAGDLRENPSLEELKELSRTAGLEVLAEIYQKRESSAAGSYLGRGKLDEVRQEIQKHNINVVVADDELTPRQQKHLEESLGIKVIDRAILILDIFASRAKSKEGKLQVELAQLKSLLPKLSGQGTSLSRLGGGIGTRGPGETKLEVDKRLIRKRINILEKQLDLVLKAREHRSTGKKEFYQVALVGYTNAGKSTLMNLMADETQKAQDLLFATLDPVTRKVCTKKHGCFLLSDTVGFIHKLPHDLIAAFRATLDEVQSADLLLHVVDGSNAECMHQIRSVLSVLNELEVEEKPQIVVLNKIDAITKQEVEALKLLIPKAIPISCRNRTNIDVLMAAIEEHLDTGRVDAVVTLPYDMGERLPEIFDLAQDAKVEYVENGYCITGRFLADRIERLRSQGIRIKRRERADEHTPADKKE
ncbi:GTPase HflX [Clostridia bacterium]|nr:GTPase HflX [Clostridia bacterium]